MLANDVIYLLFCHMLGYWGLAPPNPTLTVHMFQIYDILVARRVMTSPVGLSNTWWVNFVVGQLVLVPFLMGLIKIPWIVAKRLLP